MSEKKKTTSHECEVVCCVYLRSQDLPRHKESWNGRKRESFSVGLYESSSVYRRTYILPYSGGNVKRLRKKISPSLDGKRRCGHTAINRGRALTK